MSDEQQQGAFGMWAEMFGLGGLMQTVQSGDFQARLKAFADAVASTEARTQRIDSYCLAIMQRLQAIERRLDSNEPSGIRHPQLSFGNDAAGTGGHPVTSSAPDNGNRGTEATHSGNAADFDATGRRIRRGEAA